MIWVSSNGFCIETLEALFVWHEFQDQDWLEEPQVLFDGGSACVWTTLLRRITFHYRSLINVGMYRRDKLYYFLDGMSGYFQILMEPEDQERTTFICSFSQFPYLRVPFGLCNASATFQRCMAMIFGNILEDVVEAFMVDCWFYGDYFSKCLENVEKVLARCEETHSVWSWEKCHFMMEEGIVLGHMVSKGSIEWIELSSKPSPNFFL